ncbi:MAG: hypothetical protein JL57_23545 [Desulfosporosinus sp. BICA1-9]|nr:MAG: hypothetical protein JL57_23545 [Desulfosporosinus sp. BICA1-9]
MGDPIEIEALRKVFEKETNKKGFCAIEVMDLLIEKNIFDLSDGDLVAKRDAKIIETVTEDIFDACRLNCFDIGANPIKAQSIPRIE